MPVLPPGDFESSHRGLGLRPSYLESLLAGGSSSLMFALAITTADIYEDSVRARRSSKIALLPSCFMFITPFRHVYPHIYTEPVHYTLRAQLISSSELY